MRTMYDAVTAANIPRSAAMVAGYIDRIKLLPWTAADWARFPSAVKVEIVKKASTNAGHVLDVEPGDATPAEAPGWVRMRRAAGADPTIYCNTSTWPAVRAAFRSADVAEPHYWLAVYDGDPKWRDGWAAAGVVAKQYGGDVPGGYDLSSVADYWPGVDGEDDMPYTENQIVNMVKQGVGQQLFEQRVDNSNLFDGDRQGRAFYAWATAMLNAMQAQIGGLTDTVAKLASNPDATPEQIRLWLKEAVAESITVSGEFHIEHVEPVIGPHEQTSDQSAPEGSQ